MVGVYVTLAVQLEPAPLGAHEVSLTALSEPWLGGVTMNVRLGLSASLALRVIGFAVSSAVVTD